MKEFSSIRNRQISFLPTIQKVERKNCSKRQFKNMVRNLPDLSRKKVSLAPSCQIFSLPPPFARRIVSKYPPRNKNHFFSPPRSYMRKRRRREKGGNSRYERYCGKNGRRRERSFKASFPGIVRRDFLFSSQFLFLGGGDDGWGFAPLSNKKGEESPIRLSKVSSGKSRSSFPGRPSPSKKKR